MLIFFKNTAISMLLGVMILSSYANAKPVVVVSVEPLYEIVEALMHGIEKPVVLLQKDQLRQNLSSQQKYQLLTADMVIRVGDGLESGLGKSLKADLSSASHYTLTLSQYMPLLTKRDGKISDGKINALSERQKQRDLRFWMDPKLLSMAARYITPQLVRMDPENQEKYLDNEIVLLEKIRDVAQQTAKAIEQMSQLEKDRLALMNPYFAHRFIFGDQVLDPVSYLAKAKKQFPNVCYDESQTQFSLLSLKRHDIQLSLRELMKKPLCQPAHQVATYL